MKSWFFTATDTGIGKTTVTAAAARALKDSGIDVGVMKPYASGVVSQLGYRSDDVFVLAESAGVSDPEDLINPYFFPIAASPYTAASKLGISIDTDVVVQKFEKLQTLHDTILVEGIGGILTPITKNYCVADLIKSLNLDAILVCSSKIGTINHTLLSFNACAKYGINVRGLVINETTDGYDLLDLQNDLLNLCGVKTLCTIPYMKNPDIVQISGIIKNSNLMSLLL